jgi:hypothetical protein
MSLAAGSSLTGGGGGSVKRGGNSNKGSVAATNTAAATAAPPARAKGQRVTIASGSGVGVPGTASAMGATTLGAGLISSSRGRAGRGARTATAAATQQQQQQQQPDASNLKDAGEPDASFTFDITKFTCRILDYEFNSFDIDLSGNTPALEPKVTLSGEVAGLKPPAVADKPMDPRLFVVNRSAEAVEVVRLRRLSRHTLFC